MSVPLEEVEIQTLYHKFGVPVLISSWIGDKNAFQTASEYRLHEEICNLHPEDALLCIALCLNVLTKRYNFSDTALSVLVPLTLSVIANYGHGALERLRLDIPNDARENIEFVARDLSKLARTLENLEPYLFDMHDDILSIIMSVLVVQAGAQAEIAQYVLSNFREHDRKSHTLSAPAAIPFMKTPPVNDNKAL
jgi:hypothetical protein